MPSKKRIPPYRQVMNTLNIIPGTPYTADLKYLIQQLLLQGMSCGDAVKVLSNTQEFQRWQRSNSTNLSSYFTNGISLDVSSRKEERVKFVLSELGVVNSSHSARKISNLANFLVIKHEDDSSVIAEIILTGAWAAREKFYKTRSLQDKKIIDHLHMARIAKLKRFASFPRERRLIAWGVVQTHTVQYDYPAFIMDAMAKLKLFFEEMVTSAINAQKLNSEIRARVLAELESLAKAESLRIALFEERKRGLAERLAGLDRDIVKEEAQIYMREHIPSSQLRNFHAWYVTHYGKNHDHLTVGVDEYNSKFNSPYIALSAGQDNATDTVITVDNSAISSDNGRQKRRGKVYGVQSRPDQAAFATAVRENCFSTCVVTGSRVSRRCEAVHLIEHKNEGLDCLSNGLWMRADIHELFDAGNLAINPDSMQICFTEDVLALDEDLRRLNGEYLGPTRKPINSSFLSKRWECFLKR